MADQHPGDDGEEVDGDTGVGGGEDAEPLPTIHLAPGQHPPAAGRYRFEVDGSPVHALAGRVGSPFTGGTHTWADPLIAMALRAADNAAIGEQTLALLPWALTTVMDVTPDAMGLFGAARYSGPGPTGLVHNLGHSTRGESFAAELVVAACFTDAAWPSVNGEASIGDLRRAESRLDFGVKHATGLPQRRSIESDILIVTDGQRFGVDVKHSPGAYHHPPSPQVLAAISNTIARGELTSFHFVTPTRFRPAVHRRVAGHPSIHLHEGVWPSAADRERIRLREAQAINHNVLLSAWRTGTGSEAELVQALIDAACEVYLAAWGTERDLRVIDGPDGFTYLFDTADTPDPQPPPRLVAAWGWTGGTVRPRDSAFMRGFPLPPSDSPLDRGHIIARSAGGAEGLGLNLVPQDRRLNRGWGAAGQRWRAIERELASSSGGFIWQRLLYDSPDDVPDVFETVRLLDGREAVVDRFVNRAVIRRASR